MTKIGIFYGSTAGVTEEIATKLHEYFGEESCDLYSMEEDFDGFEDMLQYDYLLLGSSTWGAGEVQNDWRDPLLDMEEEKPDFSGKTVALFGAGDCKDHGQERSRHDATPRASRSPGEPLRRGSRDTGLREMTQPRQTRRR